MLNITTDAKKSTYLNRCSYRNIQT